MYTYLQYENLLLTLLAYCQRLLHLLSVQAAGNQQRLEEPDGDIPEASCRC